MSRNNDTDLIVIGSGIAGLAAALAAAGRGGNVLVLTAGLPLSGSSRWAQGGIAAALGDEDNSLLHAADTMAVGAGLNDAEAVNVLVEDGRRAILELLQHGVPFDGTAARPALGLEAGHSRRRILHAGGGATGFVLSDALLRQVAKEPRIHVLSDMPVQSLVTEEGRVVGVTAQGQNFRARSVLLATGGYAGLWGRSTNPTGNRGFGLYLAWQAGASLADLEFVQFHPTALDYPLVPAYLLSEALRGEGALLVDSMGREVIDPLQPRDVVARAIARHMKEWGPVYLSLRYLDPQFVESHFQSIAAQLREYGFDLARDLLPVAPAAHYCMGGVRTDLEGRTDVSGLYAAGEVACTGAQGANRLASNSMLECLVFGRRAALAVLDDEPRARAEFATRPLPEGAGQTRSASVRPTHYIEGGLGARLDRDLGVERDAEGLRSLVEDLPGAETREVPPDHTVASLAARSALLRTESRGAHYRTDCPNTQEDWQGRVMWRRGSAPVFEEVHI